MSKLDTDYKLSIGRLFYDWKLDKLSNHFNIEIGATPSRSRDDYWDTDNKYDNPWVSISDLTKSSKYISDSSEYITEQGVFNSSVTLFPEDTLIMSFKLTIGKVAITKRSLYTNEAIAGFIEKDKCSINKDYLYYLLPILDYNTDTAIKGATLNKGKLNNTIIPVPDMEEQKNIAEILTTVDNTIEKTEELVEKYQQIKEGMMQDLFSRGVQEDGKLRPIVEEAPRLYKETELGMIPKDWEIDSIENIIEKLIDYRGKTPQKTDNGIPLITAKNVRFGYIDKEPQEFIAVDNYDDWMTRGLPNKGDVLFTTEAPIGNIAQIEDENIALAQRIITLRTNKKLLNSFLKYSLMTDKVRKDIFSRSTGTTAKGIKQKSLRKVLVPYPKDINEQRKIVKAIKSNDTKIQKEKNYISKLKEIKTGLMQDLLTGKVRTV